MFSPACAHQVFLLVLTLWLGCCTTVHSGRGTRRYGRWSAWSKCPSICELSCQKTVCQRIRTKQCVIPEACADSSQRQQVSCGRCGQPDGTPQIPTPTVAAITTLVTLQNHCLPDDVFTQWNTWSQCLPACRRVRVRYCLTPECKQRVRYLDDAAVQQQQYCAEEADLTHWKKCQPLLLLNQKHRLLVRSECEASRASVTAILRKGDQNSSPSTKKAKEVTGGVIPLGVSCGLRSTRPSLRIFGGKSSAPGDWPWQVAIMQSKTKTPLRDFSTKLLSAYSQITNFTDKTRYSQNCGGTLVAPQWVLTAAHCVLKAKTKQRKAGMAVLIGETDMRVMRDEHGDWQDNIYQITEVIPHNEFEWTYVDNDIALIRLDRPVVMGLNAAFACVPNETTEAPSGTECIAVGWGKIDKFNMWGELKSSNRLREATLPLIGTTACKAAFNFTITRNQMCAGHADGRSDSCDGDSGGPLLCAADTDVGKRWIIYGITSFGPHDGCGIAGKYGVYTKVTNYSQWIRDVLSVETSPSLNTDEKLHRGRKRRHKSRLSKRRKHTTKAES